MDAFRQKEIERRIVKARSQLVLGQPFYGALIMPQKIQMDMECSGLATDGEVITYNPDKILEWNEPQLQGALAMAVNPIALQHHVRREGRDADTWQRASEMVSNPVLLRAGFTLPPEANTNTAFEGQSVEQCYKAIMIENPPSGGGGGQGQQPPGKKPLVQVKDAKDPVRAKQSAKLQALQAAQAAKAMGHESADLEFLAQQLRGSDLPWDALLRDFMEHAAKNDYSWRKPNRRYVSQGLYLPCMAGVEMGELVVAVDTSGSLSDTELQSFADEIGTIINDLKPSKVTVIYCDTQVNRVDEFDKFDDFNMRAVGRGGTDFAPVFQYIADKSIDPAVVVFFTDMCCNSFGKKPEAPVLWLSTAPLGSNYAEKPPFGEVISMHAGEMRL